MADKDIEAIYYLAPIQQGLLFHAVEGGEGDPYFNQAVFVLEGALDPDAFERAWQAAAGRHPILRTAFAWQGVAKPVQIVRRSAQLAVARHDWRDKGEAEREAALRALLDEDRRLGFNFLKPPLMRLTLVRIADDAWYFINSHHHILLDGWSLALLLREALITYQAFARGTVPELPRPRPYRDYVAWAQSRDEGAAERFWRAALAGFHSPTPLPFSDLSQKNSSFSDSSQKSEAAPSSGNAPQQPPPAAGNLSGSGLPYAEQHLCFSPAETNELVEFCRRQRITLNTLVQGVWALLLARHTGERDVVFGATVSGRPPELPGADAIVGVLINSLPVRAAVSDAEPTADWLRKLQDRNSELRQYEATPLANIRRFSEVPSGQPLFESLVVFDSYPEDAPDDAPNGLRARALPRPGLREGDAVLGAGRNNYPLSLIVEPAEELRLVLCYERARLSHDEASRLLGQCRTLARAIVARPQAGLGVLPLVEGAERRRLLVDWNATDVARPPAVTVHALFEEQARQRPDALAVACEGESLTYRELDRRANQIARRLRALGVEREDRVGLCVERSVGLVAGLLGALKAGAAYVPVDPKFPRERLRAVIEDSSAKAVVTEGRWGAAFEGQGAALLCLDRDLASIAAEDDGQIAEATTPAGLAYIIYTSGSTGRPKGVAVEHRQLVHYVRGVLERLPLGEGASFALASTVAADLGHTSLFGALCSGGALHILSNERTFDPDATAEYMGLHAVDALKIVPSHLKALLEAARPERVLPRRCLVLGGEASSREFVAKVRSLAPDCRVINHYGPTETTVGALTFDLTNVADLPAGVLPIGRPLANMRAYVLDHNFEPVPVGVVGELYLGGEGVARGYHGRPGQTAERFLPDPFSPRPGGRLYRTGDRARQQADGAIVFLGRSDHQIKLRGYRIELGEIEARLREQPGVREAVVAVRASGGADRLVAYVVADEGAGTSPAALLEALAQRLPDYMVPAAAVPLAALPLTANGKIDRAALPEPGQAGAPQGGNYEAPRNEVEATLAQLWAELLGRERVGIHDNFFTLGGDSIQSLQVIARANQRGIKLTPKQLFERPTVAAAAAVAVVTPREPRAPEAPPPAPQGDFELTGLTPEQLDRVLPDRSGLEAAYPLSPTQEGMLFHTLMNPGSGVYLMQQHYVWQGALDVDLVAQAWARVAERHPMLRTSFLWQDLDRPLQLVHKRVDLSEVIRAFDWRHLSAAEQEARLEAELREELARGLDLARAPLMRLRLIRTADDAYRIVRSFHHILTDDWCFSILMVECLSYYAALRDGKAIDLPAPRPYRDYIAWLGRQDLAAAERFWRRELAGLVAPTSLGVERHGVGEQRAPEGIADTFAELSPAASEAIVALAHRHGLTANTFVQGAWALLLSRYSGRHDVTFGVTVAGRPTELPGVETIVGLFINTLPLRVQIEAEKPLLAWLQGLLSHNYRVREYEYPPLVQIQQWSELPKGQSLFKSLVVFENAPQDPTLGQQVGDVSLSFDQDRVHTNYPMTVVAYPRANLGLRLSYDPRFFEAEAVERMTGHLCHLLEDMARRPDAKVGELALYGEDERRRLLVDWNRSPAPSPGPESYVARFEAQARKTPDAVAVSCGGGCLSYAELNRAANKVARALRAEGVGADDLVAVFERRDIGLLVAALGVLKAGAAYLPLDPAHPDKRVAHVIATGRPAAIVVSEALHPRLSDALAGPPGAAGPRVVVRERALGAPVPEVNLPELAGPKHLAYVIYTSGSTGQPKGAMVEHAGMLNNVWGKIPALGLTPRDVIGQTASPCFDISVWQLLTGLLCGARVHIVPDEIAKDPRRLLEEAESQAITVLELVPSLLREIVADDASKLAALRWMLPTGEALTPELCRRWFERYPAVPLMNAYGPAECSDDVSLHPMSAPPGPEQTHVPIGRPVADVQLHVVVGDQIAPVGVTGELWVGGVGVGRGYLNDPARTAEAFMPDPFGGAPGARLYRTGDLARRLSDGTLECLGRQDDQVKVRGYRIELGEIEACLARHPQVREAAVVAREERSGGKQLVAYVAAAAGETPSPERLRDFLKETLPDYMAPALFVFLEALPLTPNGKVDRKALPEPALPSGADLVAPRTATEDMLAGAWAEVLGLARVGVHQGFFELGGHSLLAMQVVARVRRALGVELPLRALFDHPTVAKLAREIERLRAGASAADLPPLRPVPRGRALPMSFAQQRLWFLSRLEPDSPEYNVILPVRATGGLDLALLEQSFAALVRRHEALRTVYATVDGEPVQTVVEGGAASFEALDLVGEPDDTREAALRRAAAAFAERPFDLVKGPPCRALAIDLGGGEHVLVIAIHHIATDGWSMNIVVAELAELYVAARAGRPPALPPLPLQYADFAVWQREFMRGPAREAQLAYWRSRLESPPTLDLREGRPRPSAPSYRGARHEVQLDRELADALRTLGRSEGATLFMTLLAAFKVLLFARSGQTDLMVGTDVAGRGREETESLVGFFVNLLVLRSDLGGAITFRDLLRQVRETTLGAYAHQDLPFEQVVDALRPAREPGRHPLVQTLFVLQNMPAKGLELEGLRFSAVDLDWQSSRFDLGVFAEENDEGLLCSWQYRVDLFDPPTIASMASQFASTLRAALLDPEARVTALADADRKARVAQGRAQAEGKLKGLKRAAPRAPQAEALVSAQPFEGGTLPLIVRPAVDDVDLAAWARAERGQIEAWLARHGALLLRGFSLRSVADFEQVAQAVCGELFGEYGDLPREKSGKHVYGSTPYPADQAILFHNESSHLPRWPLKQWFFCVQASTEGGATPLSDCRKAYAELDPALRERLRRLGLLYVRNFTPGFDVSWQDFFRTDDPAAVEAHCRSVGMGFEWASGGRLRVTQRGPAILTHPKTKEPVFFNQIELHHPAFLEAPVRTSLLAMLGEAWLPRNVLYGDGTPIDEATTRAIGEIYERCAVRPPWQNGDLVLLDNMLVAHGRDPFSGPRKIVVAMGEMTTQGACAGGAA
jgi:amino acid adenylation domain-containing protein